MNLSLDPRYSEPLVMKASTAAASLSSPGHDESGQAASG